MTPQDVTASFAPAGTGWPYAETAAHVPARRGAVIVVGMHRSGTSLLAQLLSGLGAHLPDDRIGPGPGNPFGHWEPRRLVALNDRILEEFGRGVRDPRPMPEGWRDSPRAHAFIERVARQIEEEYGDAPLLLIKDPRLCRLLPLYGAALDRLDIDARVVLCLRHPMEATRSLVARDRIEMVEAEWLWARHVIEAEAHSRAFPRAWTSFDALLGDGDAVAAALRQALGWPPGTGSGRIAADLERIARPDHRHWAADGGNVGVSPFLHRVWQAACRGLEGEESAARAMFDENRAMLAEFDRYHQPRQLRLEAALLGREATLAAMSGSTSWRLTAPLRRMMDFVRRGDATGPVAARKARH